MSDQKQTIEHLGQAERHVMEGTERVVRQREFVARLLNDGHPSEEAEALLAQFESILAGQIESRNRLRVEAREQGYRVTP